MSPDKHNSIDNLAPKINYDVAVDVTENSPYRAVSPRAMVRRIEGLVPETSVYYNENTFAQELDQMFVENLALLEIKSPEGKPIEVEFTVFEEDADEFGMRVAGMSYPYFSSDFAHLGLNKNFLTRFESPKDDLVYRSYAELIFRVAHEFAHIKAYQLDPEGSKREIENTEARNSAIQANSPDAISELHKYDTSPIENFCNQHGLRMLERKIEQLKREGAPKAILDAFNLELQELYVLYN